MQPVWLTDAFLEIDSACDTVITDINMHMTQGCGIAR